MSLAIWVVVKNPSGWLNILLAPHRTKGHTKQQETAHCNNVFGVAAAYWGSSRKCLVVESIEVGYGWFVVHGLGSLFNRQ